MNKTVVDEIAKILARCPLCIHYKNCLGPEIEYPAEKTEDWGAEISANPAICDRFQEKQERN